MLFRFVDKTLECQDCHREFIWSAGEQEYHAVIGYEDDPKRCPECRKVRRLANQKGNARHPAICDACQKPTIVPFVPRQGRPVYCHACFAARKSRLSSTVTA